ncbi:MAG: hypothetical protein ACTSRG_13940 [Candidatus Helarchaeota archaeon]
MPFDANGSIYGLTKNKLPIGYIIWNDFKGNKAFNNHDKFKGKV